MSVAVPVYLPKEHLDSTVPRHLSKLVDSRDEHRRKTAIDFFVDDQNWQTLIRRILCGEETAAQRVPAEDERATPALSKGLNPKVWRSWLDLVSAPRAVR